MADFMRYILILLCSLFAFSCNRTDKGDKAESEKLRRYALDCLSQDKTYILEDGFDDAIKYYESEHDTIAVIEMCQLAEIRMRWMNQQDSAAYYLKKGLDYASSHTSPLYIKLANLYAHPLMPKDYVKAIEYSKLALNADSEAKNKGRLLNDIGVSYAFLGENDSSTIYLERAIASINPDDPDYETIVLNYANHRNADQRRGIEYLYSIEGENLGKYITLSLMYLNLNKMDSAEYYLRRSEDTFDKAPDKYSVNTFNNLRILRECINYSRYGKTFMEEGTERNDSVSQRMLLNRKIDSERAEYNIKLQLRLLESESRRQRGWIVALVILFVGVILSLAIYWYNKKRYIKIRKELDSLRLTQIVEEAVSPDTSDSYGLIKRRAEACVALFREKGVLNEIQKGEIAYNTEGVYLPIKERKMVRQALLECFSDFILDLKMDSGKLSMEDIITSLFSLMHLSNAAIASCIGVTDGAVRTRKSRLRNKLSLEMTELLNL